MSNDNSGQPSPVRGDIVVEPTQNRLASSVRSGILGGYSGPGDGPFPGDAAPDGARDWLHPSLYSDAAPTALPSPPRPVHPRLTVTIEYRVPGRNNSCLVTPEG